VGRRIQRILLVEPDDVLAEVTAFRLELLGYSVEVIAGADEAIRLAAEMQPDLVITDLHLGDSNALAMIETLASQEATSAIPVMVLSVHADLDKVTAAHQSGAADFLVVPYQPDVLQEKVARLAARTRRDSEKAKTVVA
jgi:DNA-binding response OmpR family regulator